MLYSVSPNVKENVQVLDEKGDFFEKREGGSVLSGFEAQSVPQKKVTIARRNLLLSGA
jgi:hypothetical protein